MKKVFILAVLIGSVGAHGAETTPKSYACYRASQPIRIDGKLDDGDWRRAPWTDEFIDIEGEGKPRPRFRTRTKMLWDDEYLYVAAELQEPDISATLTAHDSVIFHDNDFEVFLKPPGEAKGYYEFEINALNTSWDLFLDKPYREGGKADNSWDIPGLLTAVSIDGTLNDPRDRDRGWTVEIALPWKAFASRSAVVLPGVGDQWRVNFSRVEWKFRVTDGRYVKIPGTREDNWVWSPQGVINMHVPERWGYLRFVK